MNISRFFGATNREAMRQVRLALGPDALIVSNRRVNGGVEILATDATSVADAESAAAPATPIPPLAPSGPVPAPAQMPAARPAPAAPASVTPPISPQSPMGAYAAAVQAAYGSSGNAPEPLAPQSVQTPQARAVPPPAPAGVAPALADAESPGIMDAIGAMRGALETRIDELLWGNQLRRAPQAAGLFQTLMGFGFSTALLRAMLKRLPEDLSERAALQWAREELISHLPVPASEDALWRPGLALALVGPTGVGKTTTIAKLAARCVRRFGPDKLVLITTDTYRIGAHEQLKIYGQMLRVPVHVVRNGPELREVMQGVRPDQLILIDNVGISQRDRYIGEQAALLAAAGREVSRLLVLNAASHGETLDEVARSYAADGGTPLKGCIITKVDEASRLGAALDTALRYRLPIHYVSNGQKVPEHLVFLSATELVDRSLTHLPSARVLYAPTEADFAALMASARQPDAVSGDGAAGSRRQQMQVLPRLLSMVPGDAGRLGPEDLQAGCAFIDDLDCASEAYDLWRSLTTGEAGGASVDAWVRQLLRVVQNESAGSDFKHLLAVHDHVALRAPGESPAQLRATLVLDPHGAPLASPMQQLALPAGWLSSCGQTRPDIPSARAALTHQFDWLAHEAADLPFIHLFEGGNAGQWADLAQTPLQWLAQVPAITRVHQEDGATTAQALARTLAHQPVADPEYLYALSEVGGGPVAGRTLWAATATVEILARGREPLTLQMVSARLVDRESGKEIKRIVGLHPGLEMSPGRLAAWLVLKTESRDAMRHAASAWALLSAQPDTGALQHKALVAAQAGLAAWQLRQSPAAGRGRQVAAAMLGKKSLATAAAAPGLLKLFALKEMMSV